MLRSRFPLGLLLGSLWALGSGAGVAQAPPAQRPTGTTAAQAPVSAPVRDSLDPHILGITEALFDYCSKADPKGAAKVHARLTQLIKGASREALAEVRKSEEYRKARSAEEDFVAKIDARNATRVCSGPGAARNRGRK